MNETKVTPQKTEEASLHSIGENLLNLAAKVNVAEQENELRTEPVETPPVETKDSEPEQSLETPEVEVQEEEEPTEKPKFKIKVQGKEEEHSLEELIELAQKGKDYTQKTMKLAEERKHLEKLQAEVQPTLQTLQQQRDQYEQRLRTIAVQAAVDPILTAEAEIEKLRDTNPLEYLKQKDILRGKKEQLNAYQMELQRIESERQAEYFRALEKRTVEETNKLLEKLPDLKSPEKSKETVDTLVNFLKTEGFSDQEIGTIRDHRMLLVALKAAQYDKLQANKPKPTTKAPNVLKSGTVKEPPTEAEKVKKQIKDLRDSKSIRDAARVFENFIK